jgi:hypothetical protein
LIVRRQGAEAPAITAAGSIAAVSHNGPGDAARAAAGVIIFKEETGRTFLFCKV